VTLAGSCVQMCHVIKKMSLPSRCHSLGGGGARHWQNWDTIQGNKYG
jgi:hypothetical protein